MADKERQIQCPDCGGSARFRVAETDREVIVRCSLCKRVVIRYFVVPLPLGVASA